MTDDTISVFAPAKKKTTVKDVSVDMETSEKSDKKKPVMTQSLSLAELINQRHNHSNLKETK